MELRRSSLSVSVVTGVGAEGIGKEEIGASA